MFLIFAIQGKFFKIIKQYKVSPNAGCLLDYHFVLNFEFLPQIEEKANNSSVMWF